MGEGSVFEGMDPFPTHDTRRPRKPRIEGVLSNRHASPISILPTVQAFPARLLERVINADNILRGWGGDGQVADKAGKVITSLFGEEGSAERAELRSANLTNLS